MIENIITLGMLVMLQVVLGFDNLLYISLESKRAPKDKQAMVRKLGIGLAVVFRIALLIILVNLVKLVKEPFFNPHIEGVIEGHFNLYSIITLLGGAFIIYTATKEIFHMLNYEAAHLHDKGSSSAGSIIAMIVVMNLVFSFDSILSAMALTDVIWVMATAIIIGGALMIWLADGVSNFLQKNRMYEVLGLFILFVVGIMLLSEGGHLAHLHLFGREITAMSKATFYFVIFVLVLTDIVQSRYRKRLMLAEEALKEQHAST